MGEVHSLRNRLLGLGLLGMSTTENNVLVSG